MNSIFGDATTIAPTPETLAEAESLFSRSPVPSLHLGDNGDAPQDSNIPDLEIDPPAVEIENGKPLFSKAKDSDAQEGLGGWISGLVKGKGENGGSGAGSGRYRRVGQEDE